MDRTGRDIDQLAVGNVAGDRFGDGGAPTGERAAVPTEIRVLPLSD